MRRTSDLRQYLHIQSPVVVAVLIALTLNTAPEAKQATPDAFVATIESMKSSVAPIVCKMDSIGQIEVLGTAVFLDQAGRFLTAAHVIDTAVTTCPKGTDVHVSEDGWTADRMPSADRMVKFPAA